MPEELLPAPPAIATGAQNAIAPTPIPPDATEEQLIGLWLHGKSPNTIRAYRRDIAGLPGLHRQADPAGVPRRPAALRRCAYRFAGIARPPAAGSEVAALVRRPDGLHAVQHWRCHPAAAA